MLRKRLLASAAFVFVIWTTPAAADPISISLIAGAATLGSTVAFSATTALIVSAGIGIAATLASALLVKVPKQKVPDVKRDLSIPDSRPPYRFVYGHVRTYGSPAPIRVKGRDLYICYIMNSRPSDGGNLRLFIDKREADLTGDLFDFDGSGALATAQDLEGGWGDQDAHFWLGLGDQTGPPAEILAAIPEYIQATDAWRGRTVLWCRLHAGGANGRTDRWPATPPNIELEMDWSKVWDPRDEAQDPDDETTWTYSANQALCVLDALRRNPIRRYADTQLHLSSFTEGADIADEEVERKYEETPEPRYETNGVLVWNGNELLDQITPMADAGAGQVVRIGSALGYAAGAYREPVYTITDLLEEGGIDLTRLQPGRDLPRAVKVQYIAPDRDWQEAELPLRLVEGAETLVGDDGIKEVRVNFVTSVTQGQRIQKITALRAESQRRLRCTLPPSAIKLVAGANALGDLPAGFERLNHVWQVDSIDASVWTQDSFPDGGVAMRCKVSLREEKESHYAWDPEADEVEIVTETFTAARPDLAPPGAITATTGSGAALNGEPRIKFAFDPADGDVDGYEWQYAVDDEPYIDGGILTGDELDGDDKVYSYIYPVQVGASYDIRVRSRSGPAGLRISEWVEAANVVATAPDVDLDPPYNGSATGGSSQITVSFTSPNSSAFRGIEFWGSDTSDIADAALLPDGTIYGSQNLVFEYTETGLGTPQTRYYFARSTGIYGTTSDFAAVVSATTS